jgi:hypothetical protein
MAECNGNAENLPLYELCLLLLFQENAYHQKNRFGTARQLVEKLQSLPLTAKFTLASTSYQTSIHAAVNATTSSENTSYGRESRGWITMNVVSSEPKTGGKTAWSAEDNFLSPPRCGELCAPVLIDIVLLFHATICAGSGVRPEWLRRNFLCPLRGHQQTSRYAKNPPHVIEKRSNIIKLSLFFCAPRLRGGISLGWWVLSRPEVWWWSIRLLALPSFGVLLRGAGWCLVLHEFFSAWVSSIPGMYVVGVSVISLPAYSCLAAGRVQRKARAPIDENERMGWADTVWSMQLVHVLQRVHRQTVCGKQQQKQERRTIVFHPLLLQLFSSKGREQKEKNEIVISNRRYHLGKNCCNIAVPRHFTAEVLHIF